MRQFEVLVWPRHVCPERSFHVGIVAPDITDNKQRFALMTEDVHAGRFSTDVSVNPRFRQREGSMQFGSGQ